MRDRHLARLCGACQAPMAGQQETCWRCGSRYAAPDVQPNAGSATDPLLVTPATAAS